MVTISSTIPSAISSAALHFCLKQNRFSKTISKIFDKSYKKICQHRLLSTYSLTYLVLLLKMQSMLQLILLRYLILMLLILCKMFQQIVLSVCIGLQDLGLSYWHSVMGKNNLNKSDLGTTYSTNLLTNATYYIASPFLPWQILNCQFHNIGHRI